MSRTNIERTREMVISVELACASTHGKCVEQSDRVVGNRAEIEIGTVVNSAASSMTMDTVLVDGSLNAVIGLGGSSSVSC